VSSERTSISTSTSTSTSAGATAARELACVAARAADDKKAENTLVLAVGDVLAITDYFVITSASNRRLVKTVVDAVEEAVREQLGRSPLRTEGVSEQQWVLVDYGDVVVHVFAEEIRMYYEIERLYRDVPRVDWTADPLTPGPGV
jgi:ribosome-associated protein